MPRPAPGEAEAATARLSLAELEGWTRRVVVVAGRLGGEPAVADLAAARALIAAKPDAGLTPAWFDVVEEIAAWIERAERVPLPKLRLSAGRLDAALGAPPQRRYAWQDRGDA